MNNITTHDELVGKTISGWGQCLGCNDLVLSFEDDSFVVFHCDPDENSLDSVELTRYDPRWHEGVCLHLGMVTQQEADQRKALEQQRREQSDYLSMRADLRELERLEKKYR